MSNKGFETSADVESGSIYFDKGGCEVVKFWVIHDNFLDINVESTAVYERELENEGDELIIICTSGEEFLRSNVGFIVIIDETPETDVADLFRVDFLVCNLSKVDPRIGCVTDGFVAFTSGSPNSNVDVVCRII